MFTLPDYANPIIRYAAFYLGKGKSLDVVGQMALKRHPGISPQVIAESVANASELLDLKQKTSLLRPSDQLLKILGGLTPPGNTTYINAKVPFYRLPRGPEDKPSDWREVQWRGSWVDPWEAILAYLQGRADQLLSQMYDQFGVDYNIGELVIDSTIWFQHPEQL